VVKKAEGKNKNGLALSDLKDSLRSFAAERDWDQYHSPKNLAAALGRRSWASCWNISSG